MNQEKAIEFIKKNARPLEQAIYRYYFENGLKTDVLNELAKFQNEDGGFGHALELDNWNPYSNPIATNDAIKILHRLQAFDEAKDMVAGVVCYLKSHDSFDEEQKKWLFAIDSTKDYPHAVWWEKDGDGISAFNPSVSLAAFMVCFGENSEYYKEIIREAFAFMKENEVSGDALKCYILCYKLLSERKITDVIDLDQAKNLIIEKIDEGICKDISKYGVEYVSLPSDFFVEGNTELLNESIRSLIEVEKGILDNLQKEDGGFDISWQWYTTYTEFEQARTLWRARITIDKMLFVKNDSE